MMRRTSSASPFSCCSRRRAIPKRPPDSRASAATAIPPRPADPVQVVGRDRTGGALSLALTLARVGAPEAPHYCALVRDMSREQEAGRKLKAAQAASAAKTDFLAQVSHEIRTPLHAILGFAEVMMEERFGPIGNERYKDYLKDIHASGAHVMSLADDLLDLSKIEAGKLELAFAPVDANNLIRDCVSMMQPQAARERIIMRVSLFERLPQVMVDERSLKQIMLNLMSNAVKFNEPGRPGHRIDRRRRRRTGGHPRARHWRWNERKRSRPRAGTVQPDRPRGSQRRRRPWAAADEGADRSERSRIFDQEPPRSGNADRDRIARPGARPKSQKGEAAMARLYCALLRTPGETFCQTAAYETDSLGPVKNSRRQALGRPDGGARSSTSASAAISCRTR